MSNPLDEAIERLLKTHRDENEDIVHGDEARKLAEHLTALKEDVEFLGKKRMGRSARSVEREKQDRFDLECYNRCEPLHNDGMSYEDAHGQVGAQLNVSPDTVKKARLRAKTLLNRGKATARKR